MTKMENTYDLINEFKESVKNVASKYGFDGYLEPHFSVDIYGDATLGYYGAKIPEALRAKLDSLVNLYEYVIKNYDEEKPPFVIDDDPDWEIEDDNEEGWVEVWRNPENDTYDDFWSGDYTATYFDNMGMAISDMIKEIDDGVNHPNHYKVGDYEVIDIIKAALTPEEYKGFVKGNSIKYLLRAGHKDDEVQDLSKCKWYIDEIIESVKE